MASVAKARAEAERWLRSRGLAPAEGESKQDHLARLAAFRNKLRRTPRPDWRKWAVEALQADQDGETLPPHALTLAREVAGIQEMAA